MADGRRGARVEPEATRRETTTHDSLAQIAKLGLVQRETRHAHADADADQTF